MMDKLKMHSPNFVDANIAKIAELFPNCVTEVQGDGKELKHAIDWDLLKQELSSNIVDGPQERYHLNWPGKKEALLTANAPIAKTLRPCTEESVNFDDTENLFIEGDNLDALKLLQETYLGKVKMIYIDPPYNTGKDFIYSDNFTESTDEYMLDSGQKDEEGNRLIANSDSNGRFHSDWLSMMYSRLKLARNLLIDGGVIFISIDDNEVSNLIKVCNEILGEENFVNQISVKAKPSAGASGGGEDVKLKKNVEYLLCYCKNKVCFPRFNDVYDSKSLFSYIKEYKDSGKSWKYTRVLKSLGKKSFFKDIKDGLGQNITIYKHEDVIIETISNIARVERISEEDVYVKYFDRIFRDTNAQSSIRQRVLSATDKLDNFYSIEYMPTSGKNKNNLTTLYYKGRNKDIIAWLKDVAIKDGKKLFKKDKVGTLWSDFNWNNVSKEGDVLFPNGKKPIAFIQRMIELTFSPRRNDIILDFFAGASSTAHAVMQLNAEDGGNRKFIMVQLPETCDEKSEAFKAGYPTIAEISKERIRRAGKKIKEENPSATDLDTGFRVLKVDSSNMADVYYTPEETTQKNLFDFQVDNIKPDRSPEDLLFQVLLDWGVDLTLPINKEDIDGLETFFVDTNGLAACFAKDGEVNEEYCKKLASREPLRVVFRDSGFKNDDAKINVEQIFKLMSPHTEVKTI